jgi:hypothetical protein
VRASPKVKAFYQYKERFDEKEIKTLLKEHNISGAVEALTEGEGKTLLRFNTLESLRNRITQEIASGNYSSADEWLRAFDSVNPIALNQVYLRGDQREKA